MMERMLWLTQDDERGAGCLAPGATADCSMAVLQSLRNMAGASWLPASGLQAVGHAVKRVQRHHVPGSLVWVLSWLLEALIHRDTPHNV